MTILQAIILGLVEGLTEFLPISSTFHLIFTAKILQIPSNDFTKLFEVFIQSGAIFAVVILYFNEIKNNIDLAKKVFVSFLPTAIVGFLLYKTIKGLFFENESLMLGVFFFVGLIFLLSPRFPQSPRLPFSSLSFSHAILIGLIQSLAVIPGVSRSGSVIIGMLILGYNRSEAAKYSFLLAVPTIFAASAYDLFKARQMLLTLLANDFSPAILLLTGTLAAFATAFFVIKWFIGFLKKNSLVVFGIYRIAVFLLIVFLLYFKY